MEIDLEALVSLYAKAKATQDHHLITLAESAIESAGVAEAAIAQLCVAETIIAESVAAAGPSPAGGPGKRRSLKKR